MGYKTGLEKLTSKLRIRNETLRQAFAEFIGTFLLVAFGDGSVAQWVLFPGELGTYLSVNIAYGMAVTFGVYASGGISGGHINPAVSLTMALVGRLKWRRLIPYCIAQYLGAFCGAAAVYGVYYDAFTNFDGGIRYTTGVNATAGIFATYPKDFVSTNNCLADQIVGTALLLGCLLALTDKRNMEVPKWVIPVGAGLLVATIGMAFGSNCGYAINPARDLGPRVFTSIAGWGLEPFSFRNYNYFWVPIVGTHVGGIIGAILYLLLVECHWPEAGEVELTVSDNGAFRMSTTDKLTKDDELMRKETEIRS